MPVGRENHGPQPAVWAQSGADGHGRSFETVLDPWFADQMSVPSKTTSAALLPTATVAMTTCPFGSTLESVPGVAVLLATHRFVPSKASPRGPNPTLTVAMTVAATVGVPGSISVTVPDAIWLVTQMLLPSDATPHGKLPTASGADAVFVAGLILVKVPALSLATQILVPS